MGGSDFVGIIAGEVINVMDRVLAKCQLFSLGLAVIEERDGERSGGIA